MGQRWSRTQSANEVTLESDEKVAPHMVEINGSIFHYVGTGCPALPGPGQARWPYRQKEETGQHPEQHPIWSVPRPGEAVDGRT